MSKLGRLLYSTKESGKADIVERVRDRAWFIALGFLFVAFVVDFGISDYFGLPIPDAVGKWAWGFGMVFAGPKLLTWANRLRQRIVSVPLQVTAKGVVTMTKKFIRAGEKKDPPPEE